MISDQTLKTVLEILQPEPGRCTLWIATNNKSTSFGIVAEEDDAVPVIASKLLHPCSVHTFMLNVLPDIGTGPNRYVRNLTRISHGKETHAI